MEPFFFVLLFTVLLHQGAVCSHHGNRRFLFATTPATHTTPDIVFLSTEVKYLKDQLHQLSDQNTELIVQNSILSLQIQTQTTTIQNLKSNLTDSENLRVLEKVDFTNKINKLDAMFNDSQVLLGELTLNTTSCLQHSEQLTAALNVSNNNVNLLNNKLNELLVAQSGAVQTAVEECRKNESEFAQLLQANISSLQFDCSRQHALLSENVDHLEIKLNDSTSLASALEFNLTVCVKDSQQLQATLNATLHQNDVLEHHLNDLKVKSDNLSEALLQCEEKNRDLAANVTDGADHCGTSATHWKDCPLDLVFLVDETGSVGPDNFELFKDYIVRMVEFLNIGPSNDQVGVATFSSMGRTEFYLDAYPDKDSLLQAIHNISFHHPGLSLTSRGLRYVAENFYNGTRGDRSGIPDVLILLTDGDPLYPQKAKIEAQNLKDQGVEIFVLGTSTNTDKQNLIDIATDSNHVLNYTDFAKLDNPSLVRDLMDKLKAICKTM